jgi:SPW repeat
MRRLRRNEILEIYQLVLGVFLFVSPWLFAFAHGPLRIDTWVCAAVVAVISFVALVAFRDWEEWIICILGLWIAASPWVLGFQRTAGMFINVAVGILIAYLALLELWVVNYRPSDNEQSQQVRRRIL